MPRRIGEFTAGDLYFPLEVLRIQAHFRVPGQFVWHCHIVEHEDNEMMRPCREGPMQPGQPTGGHVGGH